jgi:hypothetical protein
MLPFLRRSVFASLLLAACCLGEEPAPEEDPYASLPPRRAALERMLSERGTPEEFDAAVKMARGQGVNEQAVLEARFLYHVDRREDDKLAAMLPEFMARRDSFKLDESEIFAVREDWLAVVEYVQAIAALAKNDRDGFKKHITEAFWLSPRQGSAFAPHIDRLRLDESMRQVKIEPGLELPDVLAGKPVALGSLMKDKKALLLHFWSPWSRECEDSMPDFKVVALELGKHGVAVASLLVESTPDALKDAKDIVARLGDAPPGAWLADREKDSLHRLLRIQNVPAMVLVSPEGRVLFNGHPSEDRLWETLSGLAPDIVRPALKEDP